VRGLMTYHVRQFPVPEDQARQGRGLIHFLANSAPPQRTGDDQRPAAEGSAKAYALRRNDLYREVLKNELEYMSRTPLAVTYHDDLSTQNQPVFFHEFNDHAVRNGLQYLCEADLVETQPPVPGAPTTMPPEVLRMLEQIPATNVVAREQYADFVKCRQFRQTLLCHAAAPVQRPPVPQRVTGLFASCGVRLLNSSADLRTMNPEPFELPNKGTFTVNHPVAKAALVELGEIWPQRLGFGELLERCRARVGDGAAAAPAGPFADSGGGADPFAGALAELMLTGYAANVVSLHGHGIAAVTKAGDRPVASPLARAQATRGPMVTNLAGATVDLSGPVGARLLVLLDGTRDRDALANDLAAACLRDGQTRARDGVPITDVADMAGVLRAEMDDHLNTMARLSLLVGQRTR